MDQEEEVLAGRDLVVMDHDMVVMDLDIVMTVLDMVVEWVEVDMVEVVTVVVSIDDMIAIVEVDEGGIIDGIGIKQKLLDREGI